MLRQIYELMSPLARRRALWVTLMFLILAVVEVTGVTSVLPFMALAADPDLVTRQAFLRECYHFTGLHSPKDFVVATGCAVIVLLGLCNAWAAATTWVSLKYVAWLQQDLASELLRRYLSRDYKWFLSRNVSQLAQTVLGEVAAVVVGMILALMRLLSRLLVIGLIIGGIIYMNPLVALFTGSLLGAAYSLIYFNLRARLTRVGAERIRADEMRYKIAIESVSSIKTSIVLGRDRHFVKSFRRYCIEAGELTSYQGILSELPRFGLEFIAFGGVIGMVLLLFYQKGDISSAIPTVSVCTFAAYRLLPALQQSFAYVTSIRAHLAPLQHLHSEFFDNAGEFRAIDVDSPALPFEQSLKLDQVTFSYSNTDKHILHAVCLEIKKNTTVAFVGPTGSGKTTLVDILLGLLHPGSGHVLVDGVALVAENLQAWRKNIGYVPQDICLMDDTVRANIAYGIPPESIDDEAVQQASIVANLHDFVSGLPERYLTRVGDRGVRLSGGQRQRIGIARALYHDPNVLILDEATSSLDGITETAVMEAVRALSMRKTIVMIAHRLSTVRDCDEIFMLENGSVAYQGTYDELIEHSNSFRLMAAHSSGPNP